MAWTKEAIREKLQSDNLWLTRGIVAIFNNQTEAEQSSEYTKERNGMGFNRMDSGFLSSLAKQLISGRGLSTRQLECARKAMLKYAGQLANIANANSSQEEAAEAAA